MLSVMRMGRWEGRGKGVGVLVVTVLDVMMIQWMMGRQMGRRRVLLLVGIHGSSWRRH